MEHAEIRLPHLRAPSLFTLLLMVSYPSVGAVLFTPALPEIASFFNVSASAAQLAVTLFLVGYALGQLPYGPLSNKIGRKPALYIGLILSIIGSLLCGMAGWLGSFALLLAARVLTSLGASVGLMMTFTIVSDYYGPALARKKLSFVMVAFAIAPGAAAAVGGFLTEMFSWETSFYFQAVYGIFLLALCSKLAETAVELSPEPFSFTHVLESYFKRCRNIKLFLCGLIQGSCTSFVYIWAALAPFLVIHLLGLTPSEYGLLNLIPSAGLILGSLLSRFTSHAISAHRSILMGLFLILPATIVMLAAFILGAFNLWTLVIPYFFMNLGIALAYINCPAIGTSEAKNRPNAAAVLGFLNIVMCVITVFVLGAIPGQAPVLMPALFAALLVLLFPLYALLERRM